MPHVLVQSTKESPASIDAAWSVVRRFSHPWHPAVATMKEEANGNTRAFTVVGDTKIYRERLTYFSETERALAYTHVEGICGVEDYQASLKISPSSGDGCLIKMEASITAPNKRLDEIASGTQAIFDQGVAAIEEQALAPKKTSAGPTLQRRLTENKIIGQNPHLVVTQTVEPRETLVLFLHGIGGSRNNWSAQFNAMPRTVQCAALDLRGYGGSVLGPHQSTIDDYCNDVLNVFKSSGAVKLILCGLSFGAWIAMSYAMRHPKTLSGIVLAGGCTGMSEASSKEQNSFRSSRIVPLDEGQTPADFAPSVVELIVGPNASETMRAELLASMADIPANTYRDAVFCFTNPSEKFDFSNVTVPVLLMTGEHDRLAPPQEIKRIADRIWSASPFPDVQYEIIAGAGHVCNLERPKHFDRHLANFAGRIAK